MEGKKISTMEYDSYSSLDDGIDEGKIIKGMTATFDSKEHTVVIKSADEKRDMKLYCKKGEILGLKQILESLIRNMPEYTNFNKLGERITKE